MLALLSEKVDQLKKHVKGARMVSSGEGVCKAGSLHRKVLTDSAGNVSKSLGPNWEQAQFTSLYFSS